MRRKGAIVFVIIIIAAGFAIYNLTPSFEGTPSTASIADRIEKIISGLEKTNFPLAFSANIAAVLSAIRNVITDTEETPLPKGEFKKVMTTVFWVGESADASNDYISNEMSAWDSSWVLHYGGVDSPYDRCGFIPCAFTPKENSFYFALPYNDLDINGERKDTAENIPWFAENKEKKSVLKNTWIEIGYKEKTCYAQWQDSGPGEYDDFDYVFGDSQPKNSFGVKAGLDVSPAVWDCLGLIDNDETEWRFVDEQAVPQGPWKEVVTTRGVSW